MNKILFLCLTLAFSYCAQNSPVASRIDATQTEQMLKDDASIQLVDLRTPGELETTGKIAGALHINYNSPDFQSQITKLDKEKPILIYCASGGRSGRALPQLSEMGFKKVYEYSGGMNDWLAKKKETVRE